MNYLGTEADEFLRTIQYRGSITPGSLKSRTRSVKPLRLQNAYTTFQSHLWQMEYFIAFKDKTRLINDVFERNGGELETHIEENYGDVMLSTIRSDREYFSKRGRRVTFEYVLMKGVTDTDGDARRLAQLTRGTPCKINLIPYNELADSGETAGEIFRRPDDERVTRFKQLLSSQTANTVTVRYSRGRDIEAACGQLYRSVEKRSRR